MKIFALALPLLFSLSAHATFAPAPALSCSSETLDAGYSFVIGTDSESPYQMATLSESTYAGPRDLGTEEVVVRSVGRGDSCAIEIILRNDRYGNDFKLSIRDAAGSLSPKGNLDMKLAGKPINEFLRPMTCTLNQGLKNRVCRIKHGGAIYQAAPGNAGGSLGAQ